MDLTLLSSPGQTPVQDVVAAARPYLARHPQPVVAYLPVAASGDQFVALTRAAFQELATVELLDVERTASIAVEAALDRATVLYLPGGNTYLLTHRLHQHGLIDSIRRRVRDGLPLVGFSAGAIICGVDILTCGSMNCCATTHFTALGLVPYNVVAHCPPADSPAHAELAQHIGEYHLFHAVPVLALEDGACLQVTGESIRLARGACWCFEPDTPPRKLMRGRIP